MSDPLRERLDDALMRCWVHERIARFDGPPMQPGRYRVSILEDDRWYWQAIAPEAKP